jgi:integrase
MPKTSTKRSRGNGDGSLSQDPKSGVWIVFYSDADGRRKKRSTKTTNRRDADTLRARWVKEVRDVRAGLVDPDALRRRDELRRPLREHVVEYFADFNTTPRTSNARDVKKHSLRSLFDGVSNAVGRKPLLSDLTPDAVRRAMKRAHESGLSPRSCNTIRKEAVALANWLAREGKADLAGFGKRIGRFDESLDRRRERRTLSDDELARLFAVAADRGRLLWYALAYYAGLRRGELCRATWRDVDLDSGVLRIRNRKAARLDPIPIHPELAVALEAARPLLAPAAGTKLIFEKPVSKQARLGDFAAADIPTVDEDGRYADLHALRATLCTTLLRRGTPPTVVKDIMRHSSIATTLKHYAKLGLVDAAAAIACVPSVNMSTGLAATGTCDSSGSSSGSSRRAKSREAATIAATQHDRPRAPQVERAREDARRIASPRVDPLHSRSSRRLSSIGEDPFA